MPTKPAASFSFATTANFSSGPASGNPTKVAPPGTQGFIPGTGTDAEHVNYLQNICGQWTVWLLAGTAMAVVDTTIVERDANGYTALQGITLGGGAGGVVTASFDDNGSNFFGATIYVSNSASEGAAAMINDSATSPTITAENTGGGGGVLGTSTGGGAAVRGESGQGASGAGPGVSGESLDDGPGCFGVGGPNGGNGVFGRCQATAAGVYGDTLDAGGDGVQGVHSVSGSTSSNGAAVSGTATNGATAVRSTAADGYAIELESTGTNRPTARFVPQGAPAAAQEGDVWVQQNGGLSQIRHRAAFGSCGVWSSPLGSCHAGAVDATAAIGTGAGTVDVLSVTLNGDNAPQIAGGTLTITAACQVVRAVSAAGPFNELEIEVYDQTSGAVVLGPVNVGVPTQSIAGIPFRQFHLSGRVAYPAAGNREYRMRARCSTSNYTLEDISLKVEGIF